ncbi:MAG: (2Fe-2S)-binding protein [Pseudomonadota bacterium]
MKVIRKDEATAVSCVVNGERVSGSCEPRTLLTDFLRHEIGATGVHVGCEHGVCGACTILLNGRSVRACLTFAVQAQGADIETVEGLSLDGAALSDLQAAFRKRHALQCGFCTPGILISMTQLLTEEPMVTEDRVRDVLSGHLCRCTGYEGIVDAVLDVAAQRAHEESEPA